MIRCDRREFFEIREIKTNWLNKIIIIKFILCFLSNFFSSSWLFPSLITLFSATTTASVRSTPTFHFSSHVQKEDRVRPKYQCLTPRRTHFRRVFVSGVLPTRGSAAPTPCRSFIVHKSRRDLAWASHSRLSERTCRSTLIQVARAKSSNPKPWTRFCNSRLGERDSLGRNLQRFVSVHAHNAPKSYQNSV